MSPKRLAQLAGYAALGPITGPCVAGFLRNLRGGAPILAALYLVALPLVLLALGGIETWLVARLAG